MSSGHGLTRDVTAAVAAHLRADGAYVLPEVPAPPSPNRTGTRKVSRLIDLLAITRSMEPGEVYLTAVEVKARRQDYAAELRDPTKQAPWRSIAGWHYFAAPAGVIDPATLPDGSGLLVVSEDGTVAVEVSARPNMPTSQHLPFWLLEPMLAQADRHAAVINGWATDPTPEVDLHAQIKHLLTENREAWKKHAEQRDKAAAWRALAARQGHKVPCADCGRPVVPVRFNAGAFTSWRHAQPHLATDCPGEHAGVRPREDNSDEEKETVTR